MRIMTTEQRERQHHMMRARKDFLKAEGRCIDCKAPKGENDDHVRCIRCRRMYSDREVAREKAQRLMRISPKPATPADTVHMRNAKTLSEELFYDDGLAKDLRAGLLAVIEEWKAKFERRAA